jgi:flagellar basal-body rod protein FlgB
MIVNNNFTRTVDMLHRAMGVSSAREAVIADNLANADVPGFKRSVLNYESELARAIETEKQKPVLELDRTHPSHFTNWEPRNYQDVEVRRVLDYTTTMKNNGNNVDPEYEFNLALENQLRYMLLVNSANFEFGQVNQVLRSS